MPEIAFQDREELLQSLVTLPPQTILNLLGEAGVGKSRLVREVCRVLREGRTAPGLALLLDLEAFARDDAPERDLATRALALLARLKEQAPELLTTGDCADPQEVAALVCKQLGELAEQFPVYLLFDSTETYQADRPLWAWLEANLIGPLAVVGDVRQILAGRVRPPLQRPEVRRAMQSQHVEVLQGPHAPTLVSAAWQALCPIPQTATRLTQQDAALVLELSAGNPRLVEKLTAYLAGLSAVPQPDALLPDLCREVVKPFITGEVLRDIRADWQEILWWACVLYAFDDPSLRRYLAFTAPELLTGQPIRFFIEGIGELRNRGAIYWRDYTGYQFQGMTARIMQRCLRVLDPARYTLALGAAQQAAAEFEFLIEPQAVVTDG